MENRLTSSTSLPMRTMAVLVCAVLAIAMLGGAGPATSDQAFAKTKVKVSKVSTSTPTGKTLHVAKGKTNKITAKVSVKPNKKANKKVSFKSANTKVATVSSKGVVKGKKIGSTKVTVSSKKNAKKKAAVKVKVTTPVKSISVAGASITKGASKQLKASVAPAKAYKGVRWSSSKPSVAKVNAAGRVTGIAPGKATITATALDGTKKKGSCTVSVAAARTTKAKITGLQILNPNQSNCSDSLLVTLSAPASITKSQVHVTSGEANSSNDPSHLNIEGVSSKDKGKSWTITLNGEAISRGELVQISIDDVDGSGSALFESANSSLNESVSTLVGLPKKIDPYDYSLNLGYVRDVSLESNPDNLVCWDESEQNYFVNSTVAKSGTATLIVTDNLGSTCTINLTVTCKSIESAVCQTMDSEGNATVANVNGTEYKVVKFTPDENGTYCFESTCDDYDTYGVLFDSNGNILAENDDVDDGNFAIVQECDKWNSYYLAVRFYGDWQEGDIPIKISWAEKRTVTIDSNAFWAAHPDANSLMVSAYASYEDYMDDAEPLSTKTMAHGETGALSLYPGCYHVVVTVDENQYTGGDLRCPNRDGTSYEVWDGSSENFGD